MKITLIDQCALMEERDKKEKADLKKKILSQKLILDEQVSRDLPIKNKAYEEREAWVNRKILKKMGVTLPDLNFF